MGISKTSGPVFFEIGESDRIRGRGVSREEPELVLEVEVIDIVEIARPEFVALLVLPLTHGHIGERPQIGLNGTLIVQVIIKLRGGGGCGEPIYDVEFAQPRLDRAVRGKALRSG